MLIGLSILQGVTTHSSVEQARSADRILFYKSDCEHNSAYFKWMQDEEIKDKLQQTQSKRAFIDCKVHKQFCSEHNVYNLPLLVRSQNGKFQPLHIRTDSDSAIKQFHPGNAARLIRQNVRLFLYLSQYPLQRLDSRVFWLNSSSEFGREHLEWLGEGLWAVQFGQRIRRFNLQNRFDLIQNYGSVQQYHKSEKVRSQDKHTLNYQHLLLRMQLADRHTLLLLHSQTCKHSLYAKLVFERASKHKVQGLDFFSYDLSSNDDIFNVERVPQVRLFGKGQEAVYKGKLKERDIIEWARASMA